MPSKHQLCVKSVSVVQLQDDIFGRLFHSPLIRAARTAEIVWSSRAGPISVLPCLREIDLYSFQAREPCSDQALP